MTDAPTTTPKPAEMLRGGLTSYFGGKSILAPAICARFPAHRAYWEIFGGGASVLLEKKPAAWEVYNDLNGRMVNLARVIASPRWTDLNERLARTMHAEALFNEARGICENGLSLAPSIAAVSDEHIESAYWYFVLNWQGRGGVGGIRATNAHPARRYTSSGGGSSIRFRSACVSLQAFHDRLAAVEIRQEDAIRLSGLIEDQAGTLIYADPPYFHEGGKYLHTIGRAEHATLETNLRAKRKTAVVVSEYDSPEVRELWSTARGWTIEAMPTSKPTGNHARRGARITASIAPEVLIYNEPCAAAFAGGGLFSGVEA